MQWLSKIADEIERRNPDGAILIESGGSPSGTHHLGHLRELITSDAVIRELRRRGREDAKHIYFVDDLDALRKIPVDVPAEFEKYLGQPLCDIPAPDGSDRSYGDFFIQGLKDAAAALGLDMEFIHSHKKYREGFFVPAIERSLDRINESKKILETISGHKLGEEWSPIQVNEDGYLKKRPFLSISTEEKLLRYKDKDGKERETGYGHGEVKLDWRLDWPGRWWLLKIDAEPFGRDHATKGGSYDTGEAIMKDVYEASAPLPIPYDFVNLAGDTKKMSASKGTGLSAEDVVRALPPEIIRFLMLRYSPNKRLYFDPENGVAQLIDDFAEMMDKDPDNSILYFSRDGLEPVISRVPFSHLAASYQASLKNPEETLKLLARSGYSDVVKANRQLLIEELKFVNEWLEKWAPEEVKFSIEESIGRGLEQLNLDNKQREFLRNLADKIEEAPDNADGEWYHKAIYEFKDSSGLSPKELFSTLYRVLINKAYGPRAGWFLETLITLRSKSWLVARLRLES
jgi:lysyl-tRNA synthetase class 1